MFGHLSAEDFTNLLEGTTDGMGGGPFLALEAGLRHEREWIAYWEELAGGEM